MRRKAVNRFMDKYCKVLTSEPGEDKVRTVIGTVTDIDNDAGFIIIESDEGTNFLNIDSIVAIKPRKQH